jgi:hypothetical protein
LADAVGLFFLWQRAIWLPFCFGFLAFVVRGLNAGLQGSKTAAKQIHENSYYNLFISEFIFVVSAVEPV